MIYNIKCICKEYTIQSNEWKETDYGESVIPYSVIDNMVESRGYFEGKMRIDTKNSRKLGNVVSYISSQPKNYPKKRTYQFDYSEARIK